MELWKHEKHDKSMKVAIAEMTQTRCNQMYILCSN